GLEVYDIANNQITDSTFLGTVGLEWQFADFAPVHGPGTSDLVLRNVNTGQFEVYDIANNQLTGASSLGSVGLDWQVRGFAATPAGRLHGQLGLDVPARTGDGGFRRWERRCRQLEYRSPRGRDITTDISDDSSARLRLGRALISRIGESRRSTPSG